MQHKVQGGGCINQAYLLKGEEKTYFLKLNEHTALAAFEAEIKGLQEIAASQTVRCPKPLCCGVFEDRAFLVMEFLPLMASTKKSQENLGRQLATMHRCTASAHGFSENNYIGSSLQLNEYCENWLEFYYRKRLLPQLQTAARFDTSLLRRGSEVERLLPELFDGYEPLPSLVHGDLWGGNQAALPGDIPIIFDPAIYYGDRESDLAMTEMFGGFSEAFYQAYKSEFPLHGGYHRRKDLYTLYHTLNHLNIFGTGYLSEARELLDRLLK